MNATGAGTTIASIVITNSGAAASLSLISDGAVSLGTISDTRAVSIINAPNATLSGNSSFAGVGRMILAGLANATLSLGSGPSTTLPSTTLVVPNVTDSTVTSAGAISSITSSQWLNNNGGYYTLVATSIGRLKVTGTFANVLTLTSTAISLGSVVSGQATAAWNVAGSIGVATLGTPASSWSLAAGGAVGRVIVNGSLANSITAASLGELVVTGTATNSTLQTTGAHGGIGQLRIGGAVSNSTIATSGQLGSLTTASLSNANVSAGSIGLAAIGGAATSVTLKLTGTTSGGRAQLGRLLVNGAITSSSVSASGGIGTLTATSLSSTQVTASSLDTLAVAGITNGATIQTTASFSAAKLQIGRLRFGGAVQGTMIDAIGNIGSVTAASLTGVQVYAGVSSAVTQKPSLPTAASQFTVAAHIGSVVLGNATTAFSNSLVSAQTIGRVRLGNIASSNSGSTQGVAAHRISAFSGMLVPGGVLNVGPAQLKSAAKLSAYETAKKIKPGDFALTVL